MSDRLRLPVIISTRSLRPRRISRQHFDLFSRVYKTSRRQLNSEMVEVVLKQCPCNQCGQMIPHFKYFNGRHLQEFNGKCAVEQKSGNEDIPVDVLRHDYGDQNEFVRDDPGRQIRRDNNPIEVIQLD